ncbi:hypothetical protein MKA31_04405 [[Clostridium] innocuum]|nr:hypothetical protein [[Clostridium] innocuum]
MSANPMRGMAKNFSVLRIIPDKEIGIGCILCQYGRKLNLSEKLVSLPITYI